MAIKLNQKGLIDYDGTKMLPLNKKRMDDLNNDSCFLTKSMNFYGRQFTHFLFNSVTLNLSNPDPANPMKNTFSRAMSQLRLIDCYVKKELDDYTQEDINNFISDFTHDNVKVMKREDGKKTNKKHKKEAVVGYVEQFKRLVAVYRSYNVQHNREFNPLKWDWVLFLKSPKMEKSYEDFPVYDMEQLKKLLDSLYSIEYRVRTIVSVNLMGRKSEIAQLKRGSIEVRK